MLNTNKQNSKTGQARTAKELKDIFFPQIVAIPNPLDPGAIQIHAVPDTGIPVRDYFAGKALVRLMEDYFTDVENFTAIARDAYRMADAMIKARTSPEETTNYLDELSRRYWEQYDQYLANGGTMSMKEWKDDGRFDPSYHPKK